MNASKANAIECICKSKHENESKSERASERDREREMNTITSTIERSTTWNRNWAGFSNDNQAKLHKIPSNWSAIHSSYTSVFVAMVLNKDLHTEQREKKSFNTLHKYLSIVCNWTYENSFRFAQRTHTHSTSGTTGLLLISPNFFICFFFFFLLKYIYIFCRRHHHRFRRRPRRHRRQYPLVIV